MPTRKGTSVNWFKILKGACMVVVCLTCILLHAVPWLFYGITFIPLILPLSLLLFIGIPAAWWVANRFRGWLTRLFDGITDDILHTGCMLLLISWIPASLLMGANYLLAGKSASTEILPVVERGYSRNRNGKTYWVKVESCGYVKKIVLDRHIFPETVSSVEVEVRKGGLGFDFFQVKRFV
ncbi:hypothetical protein [Chitinophaga polysaccharea]|uniref:hypothetical protein n=1 Tax=Chitinophaga polysaccharea TaxID=1293035 RepID=UPI0011591C67|nr:hypothetical protein [Chitinophaga polysaccharea]